MAEQQTGNKCISGRDRVDDSSSDQVSLSASNTFLKQLDIFNIKDFIEETYVVQHFNHCNYISQLMAHRQATVAVFIL